MNQAITELRLEEYRPYLRLLAQTQLQMRVVLRRKVSASDIVQEVLMQAYVALPTFKGGTDFELAAWLRTILANKLADAARHFRRQKRNAALEEDLIQELNDSVPRLERFVAQQTSPDQAALRHEREALLAEALVTLPEDQAAAIHLHYLAGLSMSEVAVELGRTKASVAGLLRRGLKDLRGRLIELE